MDAPLIPERLSVVTEDGEDGALLVNENVLKLGRGGYTHESRLAAAAVRYTLAQKMGITLQDLLTTVNDARTQAVRDNGNPDHRARMQAAQILMEAAGAIGNQQNRAEAPVVNNTINIEGNSPREIAEAFLRKAHERIRGGVAPGEDFIERAIQVSQSMHSTMRNSTPPIPFQSRPGSRAPIEPTLTRTDDNDKDD